MLFDKNKYLLLYKTVTIRNLRKTNLITHKNLYFAHDKKTLKYGSIKYLYRYN